MTKSHLESLGSEARQNGVHLGNQSFDFSLQFVYRKWFDYIVVASYIDAALKLKSTV